jgi:hypothetical protein
VACTLACEDRAGALAARPQLRQAYGKPARSAHGRRLAYLQHVWDSLMVPAVVLVRVVTPAWVGGLHERASLRAHFRAQLLGSGAHTHA